MKVKDYKVEKIDGGYTTSFSIDKDMSDEQVVDLISSFWVTTNKSENTHWVWLTPEEIQ